MQRSVTADERAYLEETLQAVDEGFRAFWVSAGLWGLPGGFLALTLASSHGLSGDRLALVLSVVVLGLLVGGVTQYSGRGSRVRAARFSDIALRNQLEEDLIALEATTETWTLDAKTLDTPRRQRRKARPTAGRRYYLKAGGRRFEVSGPRWLSLAPGEAVVLEFASRSGLLLTVDGVRERLSPRPSPPPTFDDEAPPEGPASFQS